MESTLSLKERLIQSNIFMNIINSVCSKKKVYQIIQEEILPYADITFREIDAPQTDGLEVSFGELGSILLKLHWEAKRSYELTGKFMNATEGDILDFIDDIKTAIKGKFDYKITDVDKDVKLFSIFTDILGKVFIRFSGKDIKVNISSTSRTYDDIMRIIHNDETLLKRIEEKENSLIILDFKSGIQIIGKLKETTEYNLFKLLKID